MQKFIKSLVALVVLLGVGFIGGFSSAPQAKLPVQEKVAYETTPGPAGSGTLGDWTTLSHGTYCWNNGALTGSYVSPVKTTWTAVQKKAAYASSYAVLNDCNEHIRVYGDSITFGGKSALAAELASKGQDVFIDAWSGRPTTPVADAICNETVDGLPEDVVVASGTNDIFNSTVMATQINRIKTCIAAKNAARTDGVTTRLFWVDVQATRWGQTDVIERNDQRNSMAVNLAIYQNVGTANVVQWTQRFMANPALLGTYLSDGVHPKSTVVTTTTGYQYWAAIVRGWLDTLGAF